MTNKRQQLNYLQYQYIYSIYYKLLCLQYFQNLSSVIRILSSEPNTGITAWLYNQNNQLLNSVDNQFTYDANGNQIEEKDSSGQLQKQYIYNTENRLSEIKDENGQTIASYYYDPFARRLSKTITDQSTATTTTTYFHYNDEGYSAEKTNGQITSFLFSPQQTWSTSPILKRENNIYYYYQNDHLGTPNILHDKQGQVVNAREMKAFGQWTNSINAMPDNFAFAGQYRDAETGTYYNFHRDYNPNVGRYIESDPIGFEGNSYNLYRYANNNPLIFFDEFGLVETTGGVGGQTGFVGGFVGVAVVDCCRNRRVIRQHYKIVEFGIGLGIHAKAASSSFGFNDSKNKKCSPPKPPPFRFNFGPFSLSSNGAELGAQWGISFRVNIIRKAVFWYEVDLDESCCEEGSIF